MAAVESAPSVSESGSETSPARPRIPVRWRRTGWIFASAIALLAMSQWLNATSVEYLAVAATATAVSGALAPGLQAGLRRWVLACVAALAMALALAANAQHQFARLQEAWMAESRRMAAEALTALAANVEHSVVELRRIATQALSAPPDRAAAFKHLANQVRPRLEDRSVVLFRGDSAFSWVGRPRVAIDSLVDPVGVTGTPFYLSIFATAVGRGERVVATQLLYAISPADRMVASIGGRVARLAGVAGFRFVPSADSASLPGAHVFRAGGRDLFAARAEPQTAGEVRLRLLERVRLLVGLLLAVALACFVIAAWRELRRLRSRGVLVVVGLSCVALTPLSAFSNYSRLFDPALYFTPLGGPLTANAAALGLTSGFVLLLLLAIVRRQTRVSRRSVAVGTVLVVAGLGPFLLRDLARGIQIPPYGVSASLWLIWEVPLFLAAACVILAGAAAGSAALGRSRGLAPVVAPALAVIAAVIAPVVWQAPGQWPWWYTFLWIGAIISLAVTRRTSGVIAAAAAVAALGATTLVWGATTRARVALAEQDVATLGTGDQYANVLAERLARRLGESGAVTRRALLQTYATSELASAGYPSWLAVWRTPASQPETLSTAAMPVPLDSLRRVVSRAHTERRAVEIDLPGGPAREHAIIHPADSGIVTIVVVARSRLFPHDPFARLLGIESRSETEPPYRLQVVAAARASTGPTEPQWRREDNKLHGDWIAQTGSGLAHAHAEIELRPLFPLVQRGTLIALLDLGIVALLWVTSIVADGVARRWISVRRRRWARSYRMRLIVALFAFFMVPAIAFAVWSYEQLSTDTAQQRELLVSETLRSVRPSGPMRSWLARESSRLQSPLLVYSRGELTAASDSLLDELAPIGRLLRPEIAEDLFIHGESSAHRIERVTGSQTLFGYRSIELSPGHTGVIAAPARADQLSLGRRARDLGVLVLFATAIGALAALWLSGIAARQLARPIGSLRQAALALASGEREPTLEGTPTVEFLPVFAAFRRMMSDLNASRSALEEAQRRTAAVLRNAASGVIAVDDDGIVVLANPRADELLGVRLPPSTRLAGVAPTELATVVRDFLVGQVDEQAFEMPHGEQQWRGRLTRLARGGAVITLDDVSEIARAQRVLAWGEMARQIAHEIKNPLTPIRLGVQHLRRAHADKRVNYARVLEQNAERILKEIDRLDEIARAFSRYGQPPEQRGGAEPTDVAAVLRDLVDLETMGEDHVRVSLAGADKPLLALARRDELREVLLNVFENARLARASEVAIALRSHDANVRVSVKDNGQGIAADAMSRIFEPHFSTRTSGSGLGLAISRRLIESWGGTIEISSAKNKGTEVLIGLIRADQ